MSLLQLVGRPATTGLRLEDVYLLGESRRILAWRHLEPVAGDRNSSHAEAPELVGVAHDSVIQGTGGRPGVVTIDDFGNGDDNLFAPATFFKHRARQSYAFAFVQKPHV